MQKLAARRSSSHSLSHSSHSSHISHSSHNISSHSSHSGLVSHRCSSGSAAYRRMAAVFDAVRAERDVVTTKAGVRMPRLIYGTAWKAEQTAALVVQAVEAGFRGIDTACQPKHYHESGVGEALQILFEKGTVVREDLFIQTKFTRYGGQDPARVPYDHTRPVKEQVAQSVAASLANLGVSQIDSLVLHSPLPSMGKTLEAWRAMEEAVDAGLVRQLGVSNFKGLGQLRELVSGARIPPAVVQQRFHAKTGFERPMRRWCTEQGIVFQSFWTLTANSKAGGAIRAPLLAELAAKHGTPHFR